MIFIALNIYFGQLINPRGSFYSTVTFIFVFRNFSSIATLSTEYLSSPKPIHVRPKQTYDLPNHHRQSSKENISKSFIIRRRPISADNQRLQQHVFDNEQESNVLNTQPSAYPTSVFLNHNIQASDIFFLF